MLRKILKTILIVISIGFVSAFIRGYSYQNNKDNIKELAKQEEIQKQEIIDDEIISSILNESEEEISKKKLMNM